jgi:hypothetical protein
MAVYTCHRCRAPFTAAKPAKWCSTSCRQHAWRASRREVHAETAREARAALGALPSALAAGDHARVGELLARAEVAVGKLAAA